jgi:hypothetical protein
VRPVAEYDAIAGRMRCDCRSESTGIGKDNSQKFVLESFFAVVVEKYI